ncbi:MAG: Ig-like domain-containing protein [Clostridia bacterium]|nr:Ig-like domain-containing protein [Clostridia bacterium]
MRRKFIILMAIALISSFLPCISNANNIGSLKLISNGIDEENYLISVMLSDAGGAVAIQFAVVYEPEKLEFVSMNVGDCFESSTVPLMSHPNEGVIFFVWDSLSPLESGGELMNLTFMKRPSATGETIVSFDMSQEFIVVDSNYDQIELEIEDVILNLSSEQWSPTPNQATDGSDLSYSPHPAATTSPTVVEGINSGITLNENASIITAGETQELYVIDTSEQVVWTSSNEQVAIVSEDGTVTAVSEGEAIITAETLDGTTYATCGISVKVSDVENIDNTDVEDLDIVTETENTASEDEEESDKGTAKPIPWWPFVLCAAVLMAAVAVWLLAKQRR